VDNKWEKGKKPKFLTDFKLLQGKCQVVGSLQVAVKKISSRRKSEAKRGKFALATVFIGF